jgi:ankyrin repeat protein
MSQQINEAKNLALAGRWEELLALLQENTSIALQHDEFDISLLRFCAAVPWSENIIAELIRVGCDPNERASDGSNVIAAAISAHGNAFGANTTEVLRTLLLHGADPELIADAGMPALHWAVSQNRLDHARVLVSSGANIEAVTLDTPPETIWTIAKRVGNEQALIAMLGPNAKAR